MQDGGAAYTGAKKQNVSLNTVGGRPLFAHLEHDLAQWYKLRTAISSHRRKPVKDHIRYDHREPDAKFWPKSASPDPSALWAEVFFS